MIIQLRAPSCCSWGEMLFLVCSSCSAYAASSLWMHAGNKTAAEKAAVNVVKDGKRRNTVAVG